MKQNNLVKITHSILSGFIPALLEFILVYSVEPKANAWLLIQVTLFWFSCGFVVYWLNLKSIVKSILFTVLLSSPWYIAESVLKNTPEHFIPLFIASIVQGSIIGFLTKWLDSKIIQEG
jgi:hypothetical protein